MPLLLREKTVVARKGHLCDTCETTAISVGETYSRQTYVHDGRVYDWVQCESCRAIAGLVFTWMEDWYDEGISRDDYVEWAREHRDHPLHGDAARAYLSRASGAEPCQTLDIQSESS